MKYVVNNCNDLYLPLNKTFLLKSYIVVQLYLGFSDLNMHVRTCVADKKNED